MVAEREDLNLPMCGNGCNVRLTLYAREDKPIQMYVYGCQQCKHCIIMTKLPFIEKWVDTLYTGVDSKEKLMNVIEQESFRLGLPRPKVAVS